MSYAAVHAVIRQRFKEQWDDATPSQMPNKKFTPPEDHAWVRLNIDQASSSWESMGDPDNNIERNLGQVTIQIFTITGDGEGEALELADKAREIFRSFADTVSGLRFEVPPYSRHLGVDKNWYQVNVVAPFRFDDFT